MGPAPSVAIAPLPALPAGPPIRPRRRAASAFSNALSHALVAALLAPALAACGNTAGSPASTAAGRTKVLTSFTVLADMASAVACDRLEVVSITRPGAQIHGYEATPGDLRRGRGARLLLRNGLGLDRWTDRFSSRLGRLPQVNLSDGVATLPIEGAASGVNPHAWMSPRAALTYVENIRVAFSRLDPAGATTYRRCADAYAGQLRQLDRELAGRLATLPARHRLLVTCEGAFSYLARDYGLQEAWLWPVNGESELTPQRLQRLARTVRERRVPAVFCESTVDGRAQRRLAADTGARWGGTFHVDSLSGPEGPASTYLALMRHNVDTLLRGLAPPAPGR